MYITAVLVGMCTFFVVYSVYQAINNGSARQERIRTKENPGVVTDYSLRVVKRRLHWINASELLQMMNAEPNLIIVRLLGGSSLQDYHRRLPGELTVTLSQLEESLPWIPCGNKVVIYRIGGIDARLTQSLSGKVAGREIFLLWDRIPPQISSLRHEIAGATCE